MSLDSGSSDAPVYFEIVAEVPPAAEQGKSCLSLEHIDPILQMLYCFLSNTALFYNIIFGMVTYCYSHAFGYHAPLLAWVKT